MKSNLNRRVYRRVVKPGSKPNQVLTGRPVWSRALESGLEITETEEVEAVGDFLHFLNILVQHQTPEMLKRSKFYELTILL